MQLFFVRLSQHPITILPTRKADAWLCGAELNVHLGNRIEGQKHVPVYEKRVLPVLIVGRQHVRETMHRLFLDDVYDGKGCAYFGNAKDLLPFIPPKRLRDAILFELDPEHPIPFNPFYKVSKDKRSDVAEYILDVFSTVYPSTVPTVRFDLNMLSACLAMMNLPDGTLYSLPYLFTSKTYRKEVMGHLANPSLKKYWEAYDKLTSKEQNDKSESILNRLLPLVTDPRFANVIGQPKSVTIKDNTILLVELPRGKKAQLLAGLLMTRLTNRVYMEYPHFFVGDAQLVIGVSYLDQMPEALKTELLGTATIMSSRLGVKDAKILEPEFNLLQGDFRLTELPPETAYVRLQDTKLIATEPHSYSRFPRSPLQIRKHVRNQHARQREHVEAKIAVFVEHT